MSTFGGALLWTQVVHPTRSAISGREQRDPGQLFGHLVGADKQFGSCLLARRELETREK